MKRCQQDTEPMDEVYLRWDAGFQVLDSHRVSVIGGTRKSPRKLLTNISFALSKGEFVAIVGASGCGKTTLIRTLVGVQTPTSGDIVLSGYSVKMLNENFPLAAAYLPQHGAFHPLLSVRENLEHAAALRLARNVSARVKRDWIEHIVELSGLRQLLAQPYRTLSGGQMRRMALAEALVGDPAFLFLDELTSGLDVYSDQEIMLWLRNLAHHQEKTVVLVTHSTYHLHYCDSIIFLHQGRLVHHGSYESLLEKHGASAIAEVFSFYQTGQAQVADEGATVPPSRESSQKEFGNEENELGKTVDVVLEPQPLKTARPPSGLWQFPILLCRQAKLFWRDRGQLGLHLALIITFPCLVAVFAIHGLPQVRNLTLSLEPNILRTMQEQLLYLKESFHAASVISGLAMFQVVLLTLIGANNGAREIAKEDEILKKELRAGLSPTAYISTKFLQIVGLCFIQAFWMAWFVKIMCGFPGQLIEQFAILFTAVLAMSTTCLAISAAAPSAERASLLAIYLVGFQLPLSGAALALPDWLSSVCRPFIVSYWGWSGYLQTFHATRHYDIVKQSTHTSIADYRVSLIVLSLHVMLAFGLAIFFVGRKRKLA